MGRRPTVFFSCLFFFVRILFFYFICALWWWQKLHIKSHVVMRHITRTQNAFTFISFTIHNIQCVLVYLCGSYKCKITRFTICKICESSACAAQFIQATQIQRTETNRLFFWNNTHRRTKQWIPTIYAKCRNFELVLRFEIWTFCFPYKRTPQYFDTHKQNTPQNNRNNRLTHGLFELYTEIYQADQFLFSSFVIFYFLSPQYKLFDTKKFRFTIRSVVWFGLQPILIF